jgi:hypothetical protein
MPAHKIGELLSRSGELKALSRAVRRLADLEPALSEAAPRALVEATRIDGLRDGTLILVADNAAVAAKLRQLVPRLLVCARKREPEVSGIRVEVQPAAQQVKVSSRARKQARDIGALAEFRSLAAGLRDSPLKDAVVRLVQRRK